MDKQHAVVRLAKPKLKGIWGILFSRIPIIAVLIAIQIGAAGAFLLRLQNYMPYYTAVEVAFTFVMAIYLLNSRMDSSAKLTWMALFAVAPLLAAVLLLYTQTNFGHRSEQRRVQRMIAETKTLLTQDPSILRTLEQGPSGLDDLNRYLNRSNCFPIYDHTEVRYFAQGEEKFAAMLEELEKAQQFIFLEYFIIEEGEMWGSILEILARKAKAGLDVRVMYDGMCELSNLPYNYPRRLERLGIRAKTFAPLTPLASTHYNYRDHRKILVIDGNVAFNGGVNLADEYINRKKRFGHWKDTALMLRGPAVRSFTLMFLQMWNISERSPDFSPCALGGNAEGPADGYVMPYGDCPTDGDKVGESVYMDILYRANTYVHIMTPYLILDGELEAALRYAAERGVDVKLILPGIPDKKVAYALAKSHYAALTEAGVKIYEYTPGFVHAKVFVSDDVKAVVGTINLDYRSLYHHFECATYLYQTGCIPEIERDFCATLEKCREVTPESIRKEPLTYRILGILLKFAAPLM